MRRYNCSIWIVNSAIHRACAVNSVDILCCTPSIGIFSFLKKPEKILHPKKTEFRIMFDSDRTKGSDTKWLFMQIFIYCAKKTIAAHMSNEHIIKNLCEWNGGRIIHADWIVSSFIFFIVSTEFSWSLWSKGYEKASFFMRPRQNRNVNYMNLSEADSDHSNK